METAHREQPSAARLGLWDTTSIIVGIIIGVGIYVTPARIFSNTAGPWQALGLWLLGGLLSLVGALCYAELASTYPRSGGEYVYLTRAYGPWMGFLFAWAQLVVIRPAGSIGVVAFGFADYWARLFGAIPGPLAATSIAAAAIIALTTVNMLGVHLGTRAQNGLTLLKVLGIAGILVAGLLWAGDPHLQERSPAGSWTVAGLAVGLMYVLWSYAGWQEAAYVTAEVRDRRRSVPLALILGTGVVTGLYLLINLAYLAGLGFEAASRSTAVAADVLALALGEWGAWAMSLLVVISALGALNGMIFTSSRIFAELGADHALFAPLGRWSRRWGTPVRSLLVQGGLTVGIILVAGLSPTGKSGFDTLVQGTAAVFWLFFLLTGVAVLVLRWKDPHQERPFRVPLYPFTPLLFCACCAAMLCGSVIAAPWETLAGVAVLAVGALLYLLSRHLRSKPRAEALVVAAGPKEEVVAAGERGR
jgi:amino acid transporter